MKLGTLLKLGALGIAATTAAAGSVLITTKALNKVSGTQPAHPAPAPSEDKAPAPEVIPAEKPAEPVVLPAVEEAPQPVVVEAAPVEAAPVQEPVEAAAEVAPAEVAAPAEETAPVDYSDMPMDLPYLAGKLDEDEKDAEEVVITPAEQKAEEKEEEAAAVAEPEVVLSSAAPIMDESSADDVLLGQEPEKAPETFADLNPHEQGYAVGMSDIGGDELPPAESTSNFADFSEPAPVPVTFGDLTPEEPVVVEEPIPAIVEPAIPVVEPTPIPVVEPAPAPVVEPTPAPAVEPIPAPAVEPIPAPAEVTPEIKGSTAKIGDAVVSDKEDDAAIKAVVDEFHVPASNLVSITAEGNMPMVFEFLYGDMRTDATLMSVYFIMPDGKATLPPETDRENVLAFGRNFITGNEELRKFLA